MSDNERHVSTEEEDTEESFSQLPVVKSRIKTNSSGLRYRRQKFCARWEREFPWLKGDKMDDSVGICTVCNKKLVCKKSHLQRHQKSFKHLRMQGFESFDTDGDPSSQTNENEFMECGKQELGQDDQEFGQNMELNNGSNLECVGDGVSVETPKKVAKKRSKASSQQSIVNVSMPDGTVRNRFKLDRFKLLKRIDSDRNALNEYHLARKRQCLQPQQPHVQQIKDTFELYFDSVCATVRALPPKLGAEVKGRISQLIAEFELRAICEREAQESSVALSGCSSDNGTMIVAATTTHTQEIASSVTQDVDTNTGVPRIVYTFQPKSS